MASNKNPSNIDTGKEHSETNTRSPSLSGVNVESAKEEVRLHGGEDKSTIDYSDTLTVIVGEEEKPMVVHTAYICEKSDFFKLACSSPWREATERVVRLPTTTTSMFGIYLEWVYRDEVKTCKAATALAADACADAWLVVDQSRLELYVLADFLQDTRLCKETLKSLASTFVVSTEKDAYRLFDSSVLEYVYSSTCESSSLRELLVDIYVALADRQELASSLSIYPSDFILNIARKLVLRLPNFTNHTELRDFTAKYGSEETSRN